MPKTSDTSNRLPEADTAIKTLAGIMMEPSAPSRARIAAAAILLDRGWGKAKEMHGHSGPDSRLIKKIVREIVYMPPPGEIESIEDMDHRSKSPSCEAMGTEGADPVLKIKTAPVFEPLLKPLGAAVDRSRAV